MSAGKTLLLTACVLWGVAVNAQGEGNPDSGTPPVEATGAGQVINQGDDKSLENRDVMQGTFMLPEAPGQDTKREKCMTVCARWGEDCLLINKGAGGMERKCRRTCKQFAEECF